MSLAAVVLSFNHPEITSRCVRSVLRHYSQDQTHLIHNGSNPEIVEQLKRAFPNIHHHVIEQNRGWGSESFVNKGFLAEGHTTQETARILSVSPKTVETHRAELMERLGIYDIAGLARFAIRVGLVSADR